MNIAEKCPGSSNIRVCNKIIEYVLHAKTLDSSDQPLVYWQNSYRRYGVLS